MGGRGETEREGDGEGFRRNEEGLSSMHSVDAGRTRSHRLRKYRRMTRVDR